MGKRISPSKRNTEVHQLLCKATSAFIDWPEGFYTFLEQLRANNEGKGYWGIGKHFDKLNHALNTQLKAGQFAFMRNAFNKYLLNRWDGACASTISRLNKIARHKARYVSRAEAKTTLAVAWESIDHFLVTGRLKGIVRNHEGFRQYLIERSSVIDLKRDLDQSLCMKQVASALGLDSKRVLQLSNAGILNLRGGPAIDGHSSWVFSSREVVGLLRKIRKRISRFILSPPNKVVSFNLAVRKLSYAGVGLSGFIIAIRDGELRPCGEGGKNKGLRKLIFNSQDIASYINAYKQKKARDVFRVSELPNELDLPLSVIRSLLKTGILSARKAINGFRYETVITKIDLDTFSSNYVVLSKIAHELHSKVDFISCLLAKRGISPVPCNAVNGRILYVFRKSDLKSVNLSRLVASARARSALERNRVKTVEAKAAAEILGTDVATVRQLIENGVLTTYGTSLRERSQQKIYLAVSTINKYRGRINDYLGLVTVKVAAKMLGISKSGLLATYVWKGRLRTFRLGGKQKPQYFKKEEVEALAIRRRQTVKSPEAARMLGVGETCVHKLKLTGALKPISGPSVDGYSLNLYLRDDVERLCKEREAFKEKCVKEGKKARYGSRSARPRPVRDVIGPRIEQLLEQWNKQSPGQHISGSRLHRQLISEGYKLGIVAVYVYLRQRHSEVA